MPLKATARQIWLFFFVFFYKQPLAAWKTTGIPKCLFRLKQLRLICACCKQTILGHSNAFVPLKATVVRMLQTNHSRSPKVCIRYSSGCAVESNSETRFFFFVFFANKQPLASQARKTTGIPKCLFRLKQQWGWFVHLLQTNHSRPPY